MKIQITFILAFIVLAISSCLNFDNSKVEQLKESDFKEVKISDEYRIHLPKYMKETKELNDDASLQFQNAFKETYIIIIDETKEEFIAASKEYGVYDSTISIVKHYSDIQLMFFGESVDIAMTPKSESKKIGGLDAEIVEFWGHMEDIKQDIYYFIAFVESKDKVYMIMAWTLKSRMNKYKNSFLKMVNSFRLLK